jgi:hypothetical protein
MLVLGCVWLAILIVRKVEKKDRHRAPVLEEHEGIADPLDHLIPQCGNDKADSSGGCVRPIIRRAPAELRSARHPENC